MTTVTAAGPGKCAEVTVQGAAFSEAKSGSGSGGKRGWGRQAAAPLALGALLLATAGEARAEAGRLEGIKASESSDGASTVVIAVSRRPTFTTWTLERPARVVIDISGTRLGPVEVPFDAGTFALGAVAANVSEGEGGARTRVVLTLRRPADYDVETAGNSIAVKVRPHQRPPAAVSAAGADGARRAAEALARLESERRSSERIRHEAQQALAESQKQLASERAAAESARAAAETAQKSAQRERAAAEAALVRAEAAEQQVAARASKQSAREDAAAEMARARQESAQARQIARQAAAEVERVAAERKQLEGMRLDLEARGAALSSATAEERRRQVSQSQAEQAAREGASRAASVALEDRRADLEGRRVELEGRRAYLEGRQAELEARLSAQAAQQRKLSEAERTLAERDRQLKAAAARLAAREQAAEETSRRLAQTGKRRETEESRLAAIAEQRRQEESRAAEARATRAGIESERSRLEAERKSLLAEVARLRQTASEPRTSAAALAVAPAAVPPPPAAPAKVAVAPAPAPRLQPAAQVTPAAPVAAARPASITLRVPSQVQRIDFVDEPQQASVIIDLDELSPYAVVRTGAGRLTLRLHRAELAAGLERSLDATEYLGPVRLISSYRDPAQRGAVRIDVDMAEEVPSSVRVEGTRLFWSFRKGPQSARAARRVGATVAGFVGHLHLPARIAGFSTAPLAPLAPWIIAQGSLPPPAASPTLRPSSGGKRRYTGRRIDLDFKGADIHNILRLLADVGGVNIVTSDDVKGEVTIKMRDVPWDQALDVVLRQKQLGQVREGNLIRVAPLQVLEKELEQEIARQKQITEVLPTETRLIGVSYADARSLTERAKDLLSPRGRVSVDERTNTLIVSDVGRNLGLIEELVRNLDTQTSQVVIEARIVEARSTFVRQIGVQWGGTGFADTGHGNPTGLVFPHNIGVGGGATDGNTPTEGLVPGPRSGTGTASPNFAVNMPAAVGTGAGGALGLTLGSVAGAFNLNLRLSAMETTGQVRILSSPRISTLDNHEATISQGVSIPISVVSAQGVQTVFVDAQLNLTVKPHVTNDGTVMMDIKVTRNEPDFVNTGARGDPTILKKEANTMMLVRDGDTAVIGGIYQRNSGLNYSKVPFFADIPVLGILFKARRENDDRTEFLVFITPRIANRARASSQ